MYILAEEECPVHLSIKLSYIQLQCKGRVPRAPLQSNNKIMIIIIVIIFNIFYIKASWYSWGRVPRAPQRYLLKNARHRGRVPRAPLWNAKIKLTDLFFSSVSAFEETKYQEETNL